MKKGIFIKHPTKQNPSYEHAWKHRTYYNSKDIPLEPGDGIVLIRKDFSGRKSDRTTYRIFC